MFFPFKIINWTKKQYKKTTYRRIYNKYKGFTMIPKSRYINNLALSESIKEISGDIVECGTWKGGMVAGFAQLLGNTRSYFLFDSFEGLPQAKSIDGQAALEWQNNTDSPTYFNNCSANLADAEMAMKLTGVKNHTLIKGWFEDTLTKYQPHDKGIALLHLDGDWYNSTMTCLVSLFDLVVKNGIIIIDDYYKWEGCSKAVHDYLSNKNSTQRIHQFQNDIGYIKK
ncbi:MAG: hypothetical protein CVU39_01935 [Chloroflexi bacterium HGW-Chloroflexi-10]|nr:MAG: hypothetical protein CVU39_01935 [Chloroflexi bacterium HGW-Chloroflexi-10]